MYVAAVLLAVVSGLLFGAVPVRQVLQTDPYGLIKAGSSRRAKRWVSMREVLLLMQIAICAVLVTSSARVCAGLDVLVARQVWVRLEEHHARGD